MTRTPPQAQSCFFFYFFLALNILGEALRSSGGGKAPSYVPWASARLLPLTASAKVAPISPSRSPSNTPLVSEVS